ncbi:MAG TPA: lamin tail domain-containing protein [Candidatus Limiplasma sp.]|nr:lamin tail domain-containing protein [Candidatus Limiplasma sp.]
MPRSEQPRQRPTKDYAPRKRKSRLVTTLPLLILFVVLLAVMYLVFPKEAGKRIDSSIYDGLVISEVMSANASAVPDENGEYSDWMEIYNGTGADLDMEGVMITNKSDRITFPFPSYVLKAGEYVIVFATDSYQMDLSMPFHGKFKIASVGTTLYLYDPEMYLIDEIEVPTMAADESYALTGITEDGEKVYEITDYYSPGFVNSEEGFLEYRAENATQSGDLRINEICPDPKVGIPDDAGDVVDWVEIYNNTDEAISLADYYLSDKENKPLKWKFPDTAVIAAHGYYLVYCSGEDRLQDNGIPHTNFSISAERESIVLSDSAGRLVDRVTIENVPEDYSVGLNEEGNWEYFQLATPGFSNDADGQSKADQLIRAYNASGVYITEVMVSNDSVAVGVTGITADYIELYNSSAETVDLSNYGLSDDLGRPRKWQFPLGASIEPGEYKIIILDGDTDASSYYEFHTSFKLSRNNDSVVCFCDPTGKVLDRVPVPSNLPTDNSYGRSLGYAGFYYYYTPTPGTANGIGYYGYVSTPSFSISGGEYTGTVDVSINIPEGTIVYYTTDGSIPTQEDTLYTEGEVLTFSRVTPLRARAFDPDGFLQSSATVTQTYFVNVYHAFSIVSIVADPDELWNEETGMLTVGDNVDKTNGIPFKNTVYREYGKVAREGYIEMYLKDGTQLLDQGMEFSLQGQYSLDMPQKSFKIKAKAKYGEKYFNAQIFEDLDFTQYKGIVVRDSGNDCVWTRFNDAFQSQLIKAFNEQAETPSTVIYQDWQPVVVYINGQYWGHYNLRERADRYFATQHEGYSLDMADQIDVLEASGKVVYGTNSDYKKMISKIKASSPGTNAEDLQYILDNIDVDNYFDYMAFEMFFGNSDPGNIRFYRMRVDGAKWKWIFYDADYGMFNSEFDSPTSYLDPDGAGKQDIDNTLIVKLLENDEMLDKFLTRLGEIYQFLTTENMLEVFNSMADTLEPEMTLHFSRWAEENDKAINFDSPTTPEGALRYWNTRLDRSRNVIKKRPTYFYEMVQEYFEISDEQMQIYFGPKPAMPDDAIL